MASAGRPRSFDRDIALKNAMTVFWEKGYEGTTMDDLITAIGVKAPSIYAAFGNKDSLFVEVVDLYVKSVVEGPLRLLNETRKIREAVAKSLDKNTEIFSSNNNPISCLIMTGAINCAPDHFAHVQRLRDIRNDYKLAWKLRLDKAVLENELLKETNTEELSEFFFLVIHGMALRAKDGSTKQELANSCRYALRSLDDYYTSCGASVS